MQAILLTKNQVTIISDEDSDLVERKWHYELTGYAACNSRRIQGKQRKIALHRLILERKLDRKLVLGEYADHINGCKLDNRRENLRVATSSQSSANIRMQRNNTSGYRGVVRYKRDARWRERKERWYAQIMIGYKCKRLGFFNTPEEAALAYNDAARKHFGEFAVLNTLDLSTTK